MRSLLLCRLVLFSLLSLLLLSASSQAATITLNQSFDLEDGSAFTVSSQQAVYASGTISLGATHNVAAGDTVVVNVSFAPGQYLKVTGDTDVIFFGAQEAISVSVGGTSNNGTPDYKSTYTSQISLSGVLGTPYTTSFNDSENVNHLGTTDPTLRTNTYSTSNIVDGVFYFSGFTAIFGPITRLDDQNDNPITMFAADYDFRVEAQGVAIATPEPGTALLVGLGLVALSTRRRASRRRQ